MFKSLKALFSNDFVINLNKSSIFKPTDEIIIDDIRSIMTGIPNILLMNKGFQIDNPSLNEMKRNIK